VEVPIATADSQDYLETAAMRVFEGVRRAALENDRTAEARVTVELRQRAVGKRRTTSLVAIIVDRIMRRARGDERYVILGLSRK
jgi:hypothetical protein